MKGMGDMNNTPRHRAMMDRVREIMDLFQESD